MKKLIMTTTAFALFAAGPAFAGCGSHGSGYSRGASAASYSRQNTSMAPRATVERKVAAAKAVKPTTAKVASVKDADGSALLADAADLKLQPKQAIAAVEALAGTNTLAPVTAEVARDCKQYSATIGSLINVACE